MATASTRPTIVSSHIVHMSVGKGRLAMERAAHALRPVGAHQEDEDAEDAVGGAHHAEGDVRDGDERGQQPAHGDRQRERRERRAQPGEVRALRRQPRAARSRVHQLSAVICRSVVHPQHSSPPPRPGAETGSPPAYGGSPHVGEARTAGLGHSLRSHGKASSSAHPGEEGPMSTYSIHSPISSRRCQREQRRAGTPARSIVIAVCVMAALIAARVPGGHARDLHPRQAPGPRGRHHRDRPDRDRRSSPRTARFRIAATKTATLVRAVARDPARPRAHPQPVGGPRAVELDRDGAVTAPEPRSAASPPLGRGAGSRAAPAGPPGFITYAAASGGRRQSSSVRRYSDTAASPPSSTSRALAYPSRNARSSPKAAPGMTKAPLKSNRPWQKSVDGRSWS